MQRTIRSLKELYALRTRPARLGLRRVVLELPGDPARLRKAEHIINWSLQACGCEVAAIFLAIGVLVIALLAIQNPQLASLESGQSWLGILGVLGALTLVGKFLGLAIVEWRFRAAIEGIAGGQTERFRTRDGDDRH